MFDNAASIEITPALESAPSQQSPVGAFAGCRQRTLKSSIGCSGIGLHSGARVTMTLHPAGPDAGIRFRRINGPGGGAVIPAHWSAVADTRLNTCIRNDDGVAVRTIEHLLAAFAGLGVDNVLVEIDGEEVPVMDGSAAPFVFLIECAGVVEQPAPRQAIKILKRVAVTDDDKCAMLIPADDFSLSVEIDFAVGAIGRQQCAVSMDAARFKSDISRARTFGFEQEVAAMHAAGLARGGSLDNAVVISGDGTHVLNEGGLRYDDEFVRHKVLDALGDLALAGAPIVGHFRGVRTGHGLNNRLLRALFADRGAWTWVPLGIYGASMPAVFPPSATPSHRLVAAAS